VLAVRSLFAIFEHSSVTIIELVGIDHASRFTYDLMQFILLKLMTHIIKINSLKYCACVQGRIKTTEVPGVIFFGGSFTVAELQNFFVLGQT